MKKIVLIVSTFVLMFSFCLMGVNATTATIDPQKNIALPYDLFVDAENKFEITGLNSYTVSVQVVDVTSTDSNNQLVKKIDNVFAMIPNLKTAEKELAGYQSGTTEYTNASSNVDLYKSTIDDAIFADDFKTLIDDYNDANWVAVENGSNIIPVTGLKENNYYVVWLKVVSGSNTYYEYHPYKMVKSTYYDNVITTTTTTTTNPDTGIETSLLYICVSIAIVGGTLLVVNKNKESYE